MIGRDYSLQYIYFTTTIFLYGVNYRGLKVGKGQKMRFKLMIPFIVLMLICSGIAIADQKVISSENDFIAGSFSNMQLNIEPTSTSCIYRYISLGYDFYTSGQQNCASGYECNSLGYCFGTNICMAKTSAFYESRLYSNGDLGGISGANAKCASVFGPGWVFANCGDSRCPDLEDRLGASGFSYCNDVTDNCNSWTHDGASYKGSYTGAGTYVKDGAQWCRGVTYLLCVKT